MPGRVLALFGLAGLLLLAACAAADRFGDRAVSYNIEAEAARTRVLLLNIMRSAYRRPLQFTDVTTISGQATASGGFATILPLGGLLSGYQINPTATVSGGPTFSVATLNNKEFYSGLLTPISLQTLAYYMEQGRPLNVLFTLLVSRLVIRHADGTAETYSSDPRDLDGFEAFQRAIDDLAGGGLTVKPVYYQLGRPVALKSKDLIDAVENLKEGQGLAPTGGPPYGLQEKTASLVLCFDPHLARRAATQLAASLFHDNGCAAFPTNSPRPGKASPIAVVLRSTEGVIYMLGESARHQLGLASSRPRQVPGPCQPPDALSVHYFGDGRLACDTLFAISRVPGPNSLAVRYLGEDYFVANDPSGRDHSTEVLELVDELLALNSSSKDLPAPNIITITR